MVGKALRNDNNGRCGLGSSVIAIYGPIIFKFLFASSWAKTIWGRVSQFLVASGWVGTTLAGVMGANRSNGKPNAVPRTGLFLKFAPIVFILGLALSLSAGLDALLGRGLQSEQSLTSPANENLYSFFEGTPSATKTPAAVSSTSALKALMETYNKHWVDATKYIDWKLNRLSISFAALVLIVLLLAFRLDVNEFSIHLLYRNRLARCYLGASRGDDRQPQPFTGFDVDDDIPLARLTTQSSCSVPFERPYDGPYPIICTALNLVAGRDLAWQTRKATSFIYSPLYCGYDYFSTSRGRSRLGSNAYQPTQLFSSASGPFLGTAMAISGAAATPNMGYHSSPALTFLMAVFNVRLGWWAGNTRHSSTWKKPGPGTALYLAMELFGRTDEENRFVYLSDGGHFENLGLYELVRRKCRDIIVCDASCDPQMNFGDLGNAIEKCRRDLGAEITIDVSRLRPRKGERLSRAHYAYGKILYDDNSKGRLLYIKSSLTGAEREDVQAYAADHPVFPHDSTAEQFFNETRFESYRALGQDAFDSVVAAIDTTVSAAAAADSSTGPTPQPPSPTRTSLDSPPSIKDLFDELEKMHGNGLPPTRTGSLDLEELPFGKMKLTFRAL